ncbi:MAG: hypothetical protein ABEH56_06695 [Salinirussus sp.]
MPMKRSGPAGDWREIDSFDGGLGWIAHPDERMQRASHALATDEGVYVVDPVDAPGVDDLLAEHGDVAGVVVLLDRHRRDAATLARRHDVAVHLPRTVRGIADDLGAPTETFSRELGDTGYLVHEVVDNALWSEAALYSEETGVLVVPEAVGTSDYFLASGERLGVHPALRLVPPKGLRRFSPDRVLVGHGGGVHEDASRALDDAIAGARSRAPGLYARTARSMLPF